MKAYGLREQGLSVDDGHQPDVEAVDIHQVEDVIEDGNPGSSRLVGILDADSSLQLLEAGALAIEGDDLTVDDNLMLVRLEGISHLWIRVVQMLLAARQQADRRPFFERHATLAIQFVLEDPVRIRKPLLGECRQHWIDPLRHGCPAGPPALFRWKDVDQTTHPLRPRRLPIYCVKGCPKRSAEATSVSGLRFFTPLTARAGYPNGMTARTS